MGLRDPPENLDKWDPPAPWDKRDRLDEGECLERKGRLAHPATRDPWDHVDPKEILDDQV